MFIRIKPLPTLRAGIVEEFARLSLQMINRAIQDYRRHLKEVIEREGASVEV